MIQVFFLQFTSCIYATNIDFPILHNIPVPHQHHFLPFILLLKLKQKLTKQIKCSHTCTVNTGSNWLSNYSLSLSFHSWLCLTNFTLNELTMELSFQETVSIIPSDLQSNDFFWCITYFREKFSAALYSKLFKSKLVNKNWRSCRNRWRVLGPSHTGVACFRTNDPNCFSLRHYSVHLDRKMKFAKPML